MSEVPREFTLETADGALLAGEISGPEPGTAGPPLVLLHGLTASRRYAVMGSRSLERSGHTMVLYDARGHGRSRGPDRAGPEAYVYERLALDLLEVLDWLQIERALLSGVSMGGHTIARFALQHPDRVAALAFITPAFDPDTYLDERRLAEWDALARGLRESGVEGFMAAYDLTTLPQAWRDTVGTAVRQRMELHERPHEVATALEGVPSSAPFAAIADLGAIAVPSLIVASRDAIDPGHPLAVAEAYASAIPAARLVVEPDEDPPRSPIAWQGGRLSRLLAELAEEVP